jgi:selenoprotein W-related protein
LTAKLLRFKQDIGQLTLVPSGGGVFEVSVNGTKLHSKKETGKFPDEDAIVEKIGKWL